VNGKLHRLEEKGNNIRGKRGEKVEEKEKKAKDNMKDEEEN
jgi:hypothetical protein